MPIVNRLTSYFFSEAKNEPISAEEQILIVDRDRATASTLIEKLLAIVPAQDRQTPRATSTLPESARNISAPLINSEGRQELENICLHSSLFKKRNSSNAQYADLLLIADRQRVVDSLVWCIQQIDINTVEYKAEWSSIRNLFLTGMPVLFGGLSLGVYGQIHTNGGDSFLNIIGWSIAVVGLFALVSSAQSYWKHSKICKEGSEALECREAYTNTLGYFIAHNDNLPEPQQIEFRQQAQVIAIIDPDRPHQQLQPGI